MALIKTANLNREVCESFGKKKSIRLSDVKFVMERYFHYMTGAITHGYPISCSHELSFKMCYVLFSDIKKSARASFVFCKKVFGYTFVGVCDHHEMKNHGYNFRSSRKLLARMAEISETDKIYEITNR